MDGRESLQKLAREILENDRDLGEMAHELLINIGQLTHRIQDLMSDQKALVTLARIGVAICVTSADSPDIIAEMGHKDGIDLAVKTLSENWAKEKAERSSHEKTEQK